MNPLKLLIAIFGIAYAANVSAQIYSYDLSQKVSATESKEKAFASLVFEYEVERINPAVANMLARTAVVSGRDVSFIFGNRNDRLMSGDESIKTLQWKDKPVSILSFDLNNSEKATGYIQRFVNGKSGWYDAANSEASVNSAVLKKQSYLMMLLGLVFMGLIVLRRRSDN